MYFVVLVELCLESHSFEKKVHRDEIVFFCEFWKYCLILCSVFSTEIERSLHPGEEDGDIFGPDFFDDLPDILFYLYCGLALKCIISSDTEDD
jgi:hypothetical protein